MSERPSLEQLKRSRNGQIRLLSDYALDLEAQLARCREALEKWAYYADALIAGEWEPGSPTVRQLVELTRSAVEDDMSPVRDGDFIEGEYDRLGDKVIDQHGGQVTITEDAALAESDIPTLPPEPKP